jgi:hypothetical protein
VAKKGISKTLIAQRHRAVLDACKLYARANPTSVSAINYAGNRGGGSRNPARPSVLDYIIDLDRVFASVIDPKQLLRFKLVYSRLLFDDDLSLEIYAQKIFNGAQHGILQRVGRAIIERGLRSTDYFKCVRVRPAGLLTQVIFGPRAKEPAPASTQEIKKRYAELKTKYQKQQEAVPTEVEPVAEIKESGEYEIQPQELDACEIERSVSLPQWDDPEALENEQDEMSDPFRIQERGVDFATVY